MSLVKSRGDSNAADKGANTEAAKGGVGMEGFTPVSYPSAMPARMNSDVGITEDSIGSLGNDGTNMSAYDEQKIDLNAKNGK